MTPVFGHGRLRLYLLKLLDESPRHGYEIIQQLRERFAGLYPRGNMEREELELRGDIFKATPHQAFDGVNAAFRLRDQPCSCIVADHRFALIGDGDHGRHELKAVFAGDHRGRSAGKVGDQ